MPDPADRRTSDPRHLSRLFAAHVQLLLPYLLPLTTLAPGRTDFRQVLHLARHAAAYALAAFDPQDEAEFFALRDILIDSHAAAQCDDRPDRARRLRARAATKLRSFEARRARLHQPAEPAEPGRRRRRQLPPEAPPVTLALEVTPHWLDLIADPVLRRRLDAR